MASRFWHSCPSFVNLRFPIWSPKHPNSLAMEISPGHSSEESSKWHLLIKNICQITMCSPPKGYVQLWLLCLCCCGAGSFLSFAPECSNFVCLSVSKSCQNEANNFMGDTSREFVRTGNPLMILHSMLMAIALALGHHVRLEQPSSSSMMSTV